MYDWWGEGDGSKIKMMNDDRDLKTNQLLPSDADNLSQVLCCPLRSYLPLSQTTSTPTVYNSSGEADFAISLFIPL